jgi:hypothetical protein
MRLYRVVMRSGINMDVTAKLMLDDPAYDVIYFFADEARNLLAATVKREEVAGIILHSQKSGASSHHRGL